MAPAAAADRVPGARHRDAVARRRARQRATTSSPCARSTTSSRRARRSTTASTSTPTTCTPALTAVFSIRKGTRSVACVEIGLHDAGGDHADHRAAARGPQPPRAARGMAGDLSPGSAASASSRCRRSGTRPSRRSAWRHGASSGAPIWPPSQARATSSPSGAPCPGPCVLRPRIAAARRRRRRVLPPTRAPLWSICARRSRRRADAAAGRRPRADLSPPAPGHDAARLR